MPCPFTVVALWQHGSQYLERAVSDGPLQSGRYSGALELSRQGAPPDQSVAVSAGDERKSARVYRMYSRTSGAPVALLPSPAESMAARRTKRWDANFSGQKQIAHGRRSASA
jgi:hypothetical protein